MSKEWQGKQKSKFKQTEMDNFPKSMFVNNVLTICNKIAQFNNAVLFFEITLEPSFIFEITLNKRLEIENVKPIVFRERQMCLWEDVSLRGRFFWILGFPTFCCLCYSFLLLSMIFVNNSNIENLEIRWPRMIYFNTATCIYHPCARAMVIFYVSF